MLALVLGHSVPSFAAPEGVIREVMAVRTPANGRSLLRLDPVEAMLVRGEIPNPSAGDKLGNATWERLTAGPDGSFQGSALQGGYVVATVESPTARIALLEARGPSVSYVNGEPRGGDPYSFGYVSLPIKLRAGANSLVFACGRGGFSAQVLTPKRPVALDPRDLTVPDLTPSVRGKLDGGIIITNATEGDLEGLTIRAESGGDAVDTPVGRINALSVRKVRFRFAGSNEKVRVSLRRGSAVLDTTELTLRRRKLGEPYRRTFVSEIDNSVQYYGVNPSSRPGAGQALFLSLHGASVEGIGQAEAYAAKSWGTLVAPTNRRPYGFDWEEVGRRDALEVLSLAQKELKSDPQRTYLTGHSMGGHGTWQIGVHFPDKFAAIAPSAGWISFWSYAGGGKYDLANPTEAMLRRASNASDTLALKENYRQQAIYIVHGDADDNVPVTEARTMRKELADHPALAWHEQPGAGHWWSIGDEPGARCVDWPGIFDTFARRRIPAASEVREISFATANPGVSARDQWVTIQQQEHSWQVSRVKLTAEHFRREFKGTTENVARLSLRTDPLATGGDVMVSLDDTPSFKVRSAPEIHLVKAGGKWVSAGPVSAMEKNPERAGGLKDIFRNRVRFVYGTTGSADENAWAMAKAKFDAETFWYRGNSGVEVLSDKAFLRERADDRNVVIYGNSDTNAAWSTLIGNAPVAVRRGKFALGGREMTGDDLGVMFIYPRSGSRSGSVLAVSGTGFVGMRTTDRTPFFSAGSGIPDLVVVTPRMLSEGSRGIPVLGFFGNQWDVPSGDWVWHD